MLLLYQFWQCSFDKRQAKTTRALNGDLLSPLHRCKRRNGVSSGHLFCDFPFAVRAPILRADSARTYRWKTRFNQSMCETRGERSVHCSAQSVAKHRSLGVQLFGRLNSIMCRVDGQNRFSISLLKYSSSEAMLLSNQSPLNELIVRRIFIKRTWCIFLLV